MDDRHTPPADQPRSLGLLDRPQPDDDTAVFPPPAPGQRAAEDETRPVDVWGAPPQGPAGADPVAGKQRPRRGPGALLVVALASGVLGGAVGAGTYAAVRDEPAPAASTATPTSTTPTISPSDAPSGGFSSVADVASAVLPSVVSIEVATSGGEGTGSGVVLSSDGLILTNNHVVSGAGDGSLTVSFQDGSTASATVVGLDPLTDLAVIKAEGVSGLTPATLGSSDSLRVGDQVVAIGSPLGLQGTVTTGIVSALDRPVRAGGDQQGSDGSTVIDAVQTDAPINPGNSGGALVDMSGRVVGINSAIATLGSGGGTSGSIGLGFSIPIDQAKAIADQLVAAGTAEHARLGVSLGSGTTSPLDRQQSTTVGATIAEAESGGAAAQAGLQAGDVVTKLDDRRIADADALIAAVRSQRPGDEVTITYLRDGKTATVTVTLGSDR